MNMPLVLLNRRRRGAFSPAALFALAEPGTWYDPSDLTTLFQDNAGTTPVTAAGQTVGLMLDKSQGLVLGPERVADPTLTNQTGWAVGGDWVSITGGFEKTATTANSNLIYTQAVVAEVGKTYAIDITLASASSLIVYFGTSSSNGSVSFTGTGTFRQYLTVIAASGNLSLLTLRYITASTGSVSAVSVKELAGNHATQATSTQRPIYGINPITGRRNLLTYTEQFDNAAWTKVATSVTANTAAAPDGTTTADLLVPNTVTTNHAAYFLSSLSAGVSYTASIYAKAGGYDKVVISDWNEATRLATFDLTNGTATLSGSGATVTLSNVIITSFGNGWYRCSVQITKSTAGQLAYFVNSAAGYAGDGTSGILVWGAQLELGSTATAYQKVVSQYEVTEAGVQSVSYLAFDGVDDGMVTNTITPAINKAQIFAGVRHLAALTGIVAETSTSIDGNNGVVRLTAQAAFNYSAGSKGTTAQSVTSPTIGAINTSVLAAIGDISAPSLNIRTNGVAATPVVLTQGTGNYLAYPLYIGRRAGTTAPLSGRIYSLIVRFGPNLTDAQITSTESYVNGKTGAY
jgi:hypothetical protein